MSAPRSAPPDIPGFTLVQGVGAGGFADVFLYTQHRPSRQVAVKVLRAEHATDGSIRQFENEADVMAGVSAHPYIVTVHDAGVAPDGRPYIVMEYYSEPHFGTRAHGGQLPVAEVLRVGIQICSAVETAHRAGILHRDIKPANVLTSAYGRPGLTDFGIAGVANDGDFEAAAGVSVAYAPREVLADEDLTGSKVADVYSIGATLYSLLAGRSPHWVPGGNNDDAALLGRVLGSPAPRIDREDVPTQLSNLLAQVLDPNPRNRPHSALALGRALQDVEQALQLPPTDLEVRDDRLATPPGQTVPSGEYEEDGTRRSGPRVVDPDPQPPVPTAPTPAALVDAVPPARTTTPPVEEPETIQREQRPVPGSPIPAPSSAAAIAGTAPIEPETVRRPAAAPPPSAQSAGSTDSPPDRRKLWIGIGSAAVIVVIALVAMTLIVGGGEDSTNPGEDLVASGATPDPLVGGIAPAIPSGVGVTAEDGVLSITWSPSDAESAVTYRVTRADGEMWPHEQRWLETAETSIEVDSLADGDRPCVFVHAVDESLRISDDGREVCPE